MKSAPGLHWFIKFILPSASYEDIFLLRNNPNSGVYLTRSCSCEDDLSAFVVFSPQPSLGSRQVLEVLDMFATPYCFCLLCWNCISHSKLVAHIYCFKCTYQDDLVCLISFGWTVPATVFSIAPLQLQACNIPLRRKST